MKKCCDYECAEANDCQVGGIECEMCHGYFCANELCEHNGYYVCSDCEAELIEKEKEEKEDEE